MKAKHRPGKKLLHCEELLARLPEQHRTVSVFRALCKAKGLADGVVNDRVGLALQFAKRFAAAAGIGGLKKPRRKKHTNGAAMEALA